MATHPIGLRVRAARILAGYENVKDFADELDYPRLGERTIRKVEAGTRQLEDHELMRIAYFTEISPAFFTEDLKYLARPDAPDKAPHMIDVGEVWEKIGLTREQTQAAADALVQALLSAGEAAEQGRASQPEGEPSQDLPEEQAGGGAA